MISDYPWAPCYEAAILETDRSKLAKQIRIAEAAISAREQELDGNRAGTEEERSAIRDALSGLRVLRDELDGDLSNETFEFGREQDISGTKNSGRCSSEQSRNEGPR
jgi:predicted  nucleic acid-binding Zn-ribbon protein